MNKVAGLEWRWGNLTMDLRACQSKLILQTWHVGNMGGNFGNV
jgi:hypothetical protein